jgi:hypothetical protein
VAFAALLVDGLPTDPAWVPPDAAPRELRAALVAAISGAAPADADPGVPLDALVAAADRIGERTVTMLLVLGSAAAAADPAVPLRMLVDVVAYPVLTGRQRSLLESVAGRPVRETRDHGAATVQGPGTAGISRRGPLTNLLPTQLALPAQVLTHRYAQRSLLYRLREAEVEPPVEPVVILLDTSPATFGPVEVVLRIAMHAITTALWAARQAPTLVTLDRPGLQVVLSRPSDLARVWARRSLEPPALDEALAGRPAGRPCVLLTQYRLSEDHGVAGSPGLRLVTTHLRQDDPPAAVAGPFHAHLSPEPTAAQLATAVRVAIAPEI